MNGKLLRLSPCSITHYTLGPSTGEVSILLGKDGKDHSCDVVPLSMITCYKICYSSVCAFYPRDMVKSDFSHDRSILISVPNASGLLYCIKISLL